MPSTEFLQNITDNATDPTVVVAESGKILSANVAASHLLGYAAGELEGLDVEFLIPDRFRLAHIGHRLHFTDDRRTRPMGAGRDLCVQCKDGSERRVRIGLRPIQRGLKALTVVVIIEVTESRIPGQ